jgi:hypothetical protein
MPKYIGNQLLEYSSISTLTWHLWCPGSHASSYLGTSLECGVNNIPRATPRKLRFPIWGVPPKSGTYSCQGTTFLDVRCTTAALNARRRFSLPEKCSWYSNGNILAPQYLGIFNSTAQHFSTKRCSLHTYSTQNLQGRLRRPEGLKLLLVLHSESRIIRKRTKIPL